MSISFCDLCNESIPLGDLERGRAVRRAGRTICARCEASMAGGGQAASRPEPREPAGEARGARDLPAPERRPAEPAAVRGVPLAGRGAGRGSGPALALGVVALVFACGAALFLLERIEANSRALSGLRDGLAEELAEQLDALVVGRGEDLRAVEARATSAYQEARASADEVRRLGLRLDGVPAAGAAAGAGDRLEALETGLAELAARLDGGPGGAEGVQPARADDLARLERELAALRLEVERIGERLRAGAAAGDGGASAGPGASGSAKPAAEPPRPAWWPRLAELESRDAGQRWSAVQALARTRDPAVAPHLVPLVKDPDIFVRMAACRVLGDLRATEAVPALIDGLEDGEQSVREAAVVSLRTISGQSFRFEPGAPPAERARRVAAWREWWAKTGSGSR